MAQSNSGKGVLGWLGRQVGYVHKAVKAVKTEVKGAKKTVIRREKRVQEATVPQQPGVTLRRTVIDEVIVENQRRQIKSKKPRK